MHQKVSSKFGPLTRGFSYWPRWGESKVGSQKFADSPTGNKSLPVDPSPTKGSLPRLNQNFEVTLNRNFIYNCVIADVCFFLASYSTYTHVILILISVDAQYLKVLYLKVLY